MIGILLIANTRRCCGGEFVVLLPDTDLAAALKRADQAMYLAKRAGKNRVLAA